MRPRALAAWLPLLALASSCVIDPVDLTGKRCPCLEPWVCGADDRCATLRQRGIDGDQNNHSRECQAAGEHLTTGRKQQRAGDHAQV